jgi:hypothetical protein
MPTSPATTLNDRARFWDSFAWKTGNTRHCAEARVGSEKLWNVGVSRGKAATTAEHDPMPTNHGSELRAGHTVTYSPRIAHGDLAPTWTNSCGTFVDISHDETDKPSQASNTLPDLSLSQNRAR